VRNCLPVGSDSRKRIARFITGTRDMMKFTPLKAGTELLDVKPVQRHVEEAVHRHVDIPGVPLSGYLLHHQI